MNGKRKGINRQPKKTVKEPKRGKTTKRVSKRKTKKPAASRWSSMPQERRTSILVWSIVALIVVALLFFDYQLNPYLNGMEARIQAKVGK